MIINLFYYCSERSFMKLLTISEWAAQVGRSVARCRVVLRAGRVQGAGRFGTCHHAIPDGTPYPEPVRSGRKLGQKKGERYGQKD
jgi:hypothetical protein